MSGLLLSAFMGAASAETPAPTTFPPEEEALSVAIGTARKEVSTTIAQIPKELTTTVEAIQPEMAKLNELLKLQAQLHLENDRGVLDFSFAVGDEAAHLNVSNYSVDITVGEDLLSFALQGNQVTGATLNRTELTTTDAKVGIALDSALTAVKDRIKKPNIVAQKQAELLRAEAQLDLGSNGDFDLSFEMDGAKGRLQRGYGHLTITMGEDEVYFEQGYRDSQVIRVNGVSVPDTNPLVIAALHFAIKGVEAAGKDLHFTTVKAAKPGSIATLKDPDGRILYEVPAGTWVATVGAPNPEGDVLALTNANADRWDRLEVGWLNVSALADAPAAAQPGPASAGPAAPVSAEPTAPGATLNPEPKPAETFKPYKRFVSPSAASNGGLNLRSAPSGEKDALTGEILPVGTEVTVVGEDTTDDPRDWVQVTYSVNGSHTHTRWVSGDYLVATKGEAAPVEAPKSSAYEATVSAAVGVDGLKLRDAAVNGAVQLRIPSGVTVRVVGKDGPEWSKVEVVILGTTYTGFVATQYLEAKQK